MASPIHRIINGLRYHETPIGLLPGVTTVLNKTKNNYSIAALSQWQAKVGKKVAQDIMLNSSSRGAALHQIIEAYLLSQPPRPVNDEVLTLWNLMRPIVIQAKESDLMHVECATHHPLGFAGTPDLVVNFNGKVTVLDWKNSRKPKKRSYIRDYLMQVAAYAKSHEITYGDVVEQAIIVCAVCGDDYLQVTDPGLVVEPELQLFTLNTNQLETHWNNFEKRLDLFRELQHNPWFVDAEVDEANLIW